MVTTFKSPLHQMTLTTPTCLWNDSADIDELTYAIENGAVGATCNPVIAVTILKKELAQWRRRVSDLMREMPGATEDQIGWKLVEEMSVRAARLLEPAFEEHGGRNGRLSIQTDPRFYRDTAAILDDTIRFNALARNMIVKIPATRAGITAIEEATSRGVTINATVCFTLPQCVAVAEAVERGLRRREKEGGDVASMGPVCTIMVGRLDDWLKVVLEKQQISVDPGILEWAGVAVFKKTYALFRKRGYRLRLLSAAFRNHMHWSELIGADAVVSPPSAWQRRFNASDIEVRPRIDDPVEPRIVRQLLEQFPDFARAYNEDGLAIDDFDSFPPTVRTLRQFIGAVAELDALVRDAMLPNPDQ
ncbi:MAG TPA: transaldolase family protein [Candidatus Dormibacteraeota bacterium]|nr:transaldolase family protein [Candidatus Dormibacteraeota bacterium]